MRKNDIRLIFFLIVLFSAPSAMGNQQPEPGASEFSQKVNLALRLTADQLLDLAGDVTTKIDPVYQISETQFSIKMESNLNYDTLPSILKRALTQYAIDENYFVSLSDCQTGQTLLGYAKIDIEKGAPPCMGREREESCYNLALTFPAAVNQQPHTLNSFVIPSAFLSLLLLGFMIYQRKYRQLSTRPEAEENSTSSFGESEFQASDLSLVVAGQQQKLTFREAKLLQFFLEHKNQLLERDIIQAAVWEEEGIIVGRSLDVFISRLRKLLKNDPKISITNVHGVGYKFEISD